MTQEAAGHFGWENAKFLSSLWEISSWGKAFCKNKPGLQRKWLHGSAPKAEAEAGICLPAACREKAWGKVEGSCQTLSGFLWEGRMCRPCCCKEGAASWVGKGMRRGSVGVEELVWTGCGPSSRLEVSCRMQLQGRWALKGCAALRLPQQEYSVTWFWRSKTYKDEKRPQGRWGRGTNSQLSRWEEFNSSVSLCGQGSSVCCGIDSEQWCRKLLKSRNNLVKSELQIGAKQIPEKSLKDKGRARQEVESRKDRKQHRR